MLLLLVAALLAAQSIATVQPRQGPPPDDLLVSIALPVHDPDGNLSIESVTMPAPGPAVVHVFTRRSVCQPAASPAEPSDAGVAWRVGVQITSRTSDQVVVSVDWRRVWDGGRKVTAGPAATVQLTLLAGGRIPLDFVPNVRPSAECRAVGAGLEVRVSRGMTQAGGDQSLLPVGAAAGGTGALNADLWLLHTAPRDRLATSHQTVRLDPNGGAFTFPAMTVATERGDVFVEIAGAISRWRTPAGEFMLVSLRRVVTGVGTPAQGLSGSTSSLIALPRPEEVVSFEMPAISSRPRSGGGGRGGAGGGGAMAAQGTLSRGAPPVTQVTALLEGHSFSLRMRVTPAPEG